MKSFRPTSFCGCGGVALGAPVALFCGCGVALCDPAALFCGCGVTLDAPAALFCGCIGALGAARGAAGAAASFVSAIPGSSALQRGPEGFYVWVVKPDETVEQRPITAETADDVIIASKGLNPGETVVVEGQSRLDVGTRVSVRTPKKPAEQQQPDNS